jgi:hypothetical protein
MKVAAKETTWTFTMLGPKFFFSQRTATHHKQFIRDGRNKEKEGNLHVDRRITGKM